MDKKERLVKRVGGKEASRGFLYQGFASVLEALTDKDNWDKIYIEFPTSNDKVDIALGKADKITKSIQVKSTTNTFSKSDVIGRPYHSCDRASKENEVPTSEARERIKAVLPYYLFYLERKHSVS